MSTLEAVAVGGEMFPAFLHSTGNTHTKGRKPMRVMYPRVNTSLGEKAKRSHQVSVGEDALRAHTTYWLVDRREQSRPSGVSLHLDVGIRTAVVQL